MTASALPVLSFLQGSTEDLSVGWLANYAGDGADFVGAEWRLVLASRSLPYDPLIFSSRDGSACAIVASIGAAVDGVVPITFGLSCAAEAHAGRLGVMSGNLQVMNANGAVDIAQIIGTFEFRPTDVRDPL